MSSGGGAMLARSGLLLVFVARSEEDAAVELPGNEAWTLNPIVSGSAAQSIDDESRSQRVVSTWRCAKAECVFIWVVAEEGGREAVREGELRRIECG